MQLSEEQLVPSTVDTIDDTKMPESNGNSQELKDATLRILDENIPSQPELSVVARESDKSEELISFEDKIQALSPKNLPELESAMIQEYGEEVAREMIAEKVQSFIATEPINLSNISQYLDFADGFTNNSSIIPNSPNFHSDLGAYIMNHARVYLSGRNWNEQALAAAGLNSDEITERFEKYNLFLPRPKRIQNKLIGKIARNAAKAKHPLYTFHRFYERRQTTPTYDLSRLHVEDVDWPTAEGVNMKSIRSKEGGEELGKLIIVAKDSARVRTVMPSEKGRDRLSDVDTPTDEQLVIKAPLAFSDVADPQNLRTSYFSMQNGEVQNSLLKEGSNDGLLITNSAGRMIVVDKRRILLSELLGITGESLDSEDKELNIAENAGDYMIFMDQARRHKLNVVSQILAVNNGKIERMNDGKTHRRLLIQYKNGDIGMFDSSHPISTGESASIFAAVSTDEQGNMSVENALYMDTGSFDSATYFDGRKERRMGFFPDKKISNSVVLSVSKE